jgi:hypothetical protein
MTFVVDGVAWPIPADQAHEIVRHLRLRLDPTWSATWAAEIMEQTLDTRSDQEIRVDLTEGEESAVRIALESWIMEIGRLPVESMNLRHALFGSAQDAGKL